MMSFLVGNVSCFKSKHTRWHTSKHTRWSLTEGEVVGTVSQWVEKGHCTTSIPHILLHKEHLRRDNLTVPLDLSLLLLLILCVLCRKTRSQMSMPYLLKCLACSQRYAGEPLWGEHHCVSLVLSPCAPPGEKQSGEQSQISWAYYSKVVRTNEIARSVIISKHLPYNDDKKNCSSPFKYPYFIGVGFPQNITRLHCRKSMR